jgi:hypothetical protein
MMNIVHILSVESTVPVNFTVLDDRKKKQPEQDREFIGWGMNKKIKDQSEFQDQIIKIPSFEQEILL